MKSPLNALGLLAAVLIPAIVTSATSYAAGGANGGGGNAVVCFNDPSVPLEIRDPKNPDRGRILDRQLNSIVSIEAYDLFEAKMPRGLNSTPADLVQMPDGLGIRDFSELISKRFDQYVPGVAKVIRQGADHFPDEQIVLRANSLFRIFDENDVGDIDTKNCVIATMAAQYKSGNNYFLYIDSRLFNHPRHSAYSKAVLFLHEALYSTVRYESEKWPGQPNSRKTRNLIRSLITKRPALRANEIADLMRNLGFHSRDSECLVNHCESLVSQFAVQQAERIVRSAEAKMHSYPRDYRLAVNQWAKIAHDEGVRTVGKIRPEIDRLSQLNSRDRAQIEAGLLKFARGLEVQSNVDLPALGSGEMAYIEPPNFGSLVDSLSAVDPIVP